MVGVIAASSKLHQWNSWTEQRTTPRSPPRAAEGGSPRSPPSLSSGKPSRKVHPHGIFFVREVLRHLAETGAIEQREGRWTTRLPVEELGIPEGVREVVGRRLSRLSEAANRVLRVAAVVGAEFEMPVLQVAGNLDEDAFSPRSRRRPRPAW